MAKQDSLGPWQLTIRNLGPSNPHEVEFQPLSKTGRRIELAGGAEETEIFTNDYSKESSLADLCTPSGAAAPFPDERTGGCNLKASQQVLCRACHRQNVRKRVLWIHDLQFYGCTDRPI